MENEALSNTQGINTFLAIFAVLGPIISTAVTAWWSRRNEINNRDYSKNREDELERIRNQRQNNDKIIELRNKDLEVLKKAVINLISNAVECHNSAIADGLKPIHGMDMVPQLILARSERIQKLNDSFNEMFLLFPPDEIAKTSQSLLDFITNTPFEEYKKGLHQELSNKFRDLKTDVLISTKKFAKKEQQNIIQSLKDHV